MPFPSTPSEHFLPTPGVPSALGLAVLRLSGGDAALGQAFRAVAWGAYRAAGAPYGPTEAGFDAWWADQLAEPASDEAPPSGSAFG